MVSKQTLIVFSHLRWNWVWQRPQHLLTRIANTFNIIFIEEPILCKENEEAHWQIDQVASSIFVWTPYTKCNKLGFNKSQLPELENLLKVLIEKQELNQPLVWLYTPLALPLAKQLHPIVMIYDVMDELTAFKDASPELLEWEAEAYRCVDVVFTGGPSLYRVKRFRHSNVHCFPSSVDTAHFSQAYHSNIDYFTQAELPHPRLGFFGVIDERIDLALLDKIAHKQPTWQIIMVGPVRSHSTIFLDSLIFIILGNNLMNCCLRFYQGGTYVFYHLPLTIRHVSLVRPKRWNIWQQENLSQALRLPMWLNFMVTLFISVTPPMIFFRHAV
jgi:UDP-galactopyranose mutase